MKIRTLLLLTILLCPTPAFAQHDRMARVISSVRSANRLITLDDGTSGAGIGFERLFGPGIGAGLEFQGYGVRGPNGSY